MSFPTTVEEMEERNYKRLNDGRCNLDKGGCGAELTWWETPNGKKIPMDEGTANPHWESCPNSDKFRGGGAGGGGGSGENIVVTRISSGNCAFEGDPAVVRVGLGRNKTHLCASHANQLFVKLKGSANKSDK